MIKACIFDLDGVIINTANYHYLAWKKMAAKLGFVLTSELNEELKGIGRMESLEIILKSGNISLRNEEEKKKYAALKNKWYREYISQMTKDEVLPGALELILELKEKKIKLGIGSSSKNATEALNTIGIADQFDVIIDGNQITNTKPNPEVFLNCAALLEVEPRNSVVFEDSFQGIAAAVSGGFKSIGIGKRENLYNADFVIPSLADFKLSKLNELFPLELPDNVLET